MEHVQDPRLEINVVCKHTSQLQNVRCARQFGPGYKKGIVRSGACWEPGEMLVGT
jgi:hypothetical protein